MVNMFWKKQQWLTSGCHAMFGPVGYTSQVFPCVLCRSLTKTHTAKFKSSSLYQFYYHSVTQLNKLLGRALFIVNTLKV